MRILLGSNALYYPAHGGGERSNRMVLESLVARNHTCLVVTRIDRFGEEAERKLTEQLAERHIQPIVEPGALRFHLNGVEVLVATRPPSFRAFFVEHKNFFRPDTIITSTDDPAQLLLEAALHDENAPTVFLTRATVALPFGPDAAFPSREKTDMLRHADGVVGVSNYVARYIREHSGIEAIHVPIAPAESSPYRLVGSFENEFVTLVNPCAVKGIKIFLELARSLPDVAFAGVPTWGTTAEDLAAMRALPNIAVLPKVDHINELLERTRVLLAPSVWAEARSRIVVEAMLAGVPVMASDLGGLPEAKMGVPYVLPVNPIEGYEQRLNEQFVPVAEVPEQNILPWKEALERLTTDRAHWEHIAHLSRTAALHYAETATVEAFETYIARLQRKPRSFSAKPTAMPSTQLANLSPERRRLLDLRLKRQTSTLKANPALPLSGTDTSRYRLFCFAHAGGGAGFFRSWRSSTGPFDIAPVQYPGHETRQAEPFAGSVPELVQTLLSDLRPSLTGSFAFFGHSMGAIVAFELVRALKREERAVPQALVASAARAPQFRRDYQPPDDPDREQLLNEVRRLEGLPDNVLSDASMLDLVLPSLEADAALYRRYIYHHQPPLDIPILALGGLTDPNVSEGHLDAWSEQTASLFRSKQFPGGHFYVKTNTEAVVSEIETFLF
jgi:surfactin synthase thioesterase subunit/glycosyltransferase involved in cell wall biosynthesis